MFEKKEWTCEKLLAIKPEEVPDFSCHKKIWERYVKCECNKKDVGKVVIKL